MFLHLTVIVCFRPQNFSDAFSISSGPAVRLALYVEPHRGVGGEVLAHNPIVAPSDLGGNFVGFNTADGTQNTIMVSIGINGAVAGKLKGTLVQVMSSSSTSRCAANFTDLSITLHGSGYTLLFHVDGLLPVETLPFDVSIGRVSQLVVLRCATSGQSKKDLNPQPVVQLVDAGGNQIMSSEHKVSVHLLPSSSVFSAAGIDLRLQGTSMNLTTFQGRAYFYDLAIRAARANWQLEFVLESDDPIPRTVSSDIHITAAPGSVILQGDVTLGVPLEAGSTTLSYAQQLAIVESIALVLGVSPADIDLLEVFIYPERASSSRRRRLLSSNAYEVIIKFEVTIQNTTDDAVDDPTTPLGGPAPGGRAAKVLARLTKNALESELKRNGIDAQVQELSVTQQVPLLPGQPAIVRAIQDMWNGWWILNSSSAGLQPAVIAYHEQAFSESSPYTRNKTLELMYDLTSSNGLNSTTAVACSGPLQETVGTLLCYSAVSAQTLRSYLFSSPYVSKFNFAASALQSSSGTGQLCAVSFLSCFIFSVSLRISNVFESVNANENMHISEIFIATNMYMRF